MAKNYYSLVAGLREYALDAENKGFDAREIINEIRAELSDSDKKCLDLFYNFYDIENIISIISGRSRFSVLGKYSRETLEEEVKRPSELPGYIKKVLQAYSDPENVDFEDVDTQKEIEKSLFEAYYDKCSKSRCKFIREWSEFDRNLRNISAAYTARRGNIPVSGVVVGSGYVAETLSRSSAADFGLKGEIDYIDQIMAAVGEAGNLLDKEHKVDLIRWNMADELTTFDYFNINTILAYLAKVNLVQRWVALDPEVGREMFRKLMESLGDKEKIAPELK